MKLKTTQVDKERQFLEKKPAKKQKLCSKNKTILRVTFCKKKIEKLNKQDQFFEEGQNEKKQKSKSRIQKIKYSKLKKKSINENKCNVYTNTKF